LLGLDWRQSAERKQRDFHNKYHPKAVEALLSARLAARAAKNWKESDRIRDELNAMGVTIKDNKDGTTSWEVKR
jgi:cysteinyl-tRNA synthetase